MSQRRRRALLKLYPSRIRRRYGDELLELQDELRNQGEISTIRLIRDAIAGAFLVRSARQRGLILGSGVLLLAALIATGVALRGESSHRGGLPIAFIATRADATRPAIPYGQTCLVSSGSSCSLQGCSVFTTQPATQTADDPPAQATSLHRARRATAVCIGAARTPRPHTLFVSSEQYIIGHVPQDQPAADSVYRP